MKIIAIIPSCSSGRTPMLIETIKSIQASSYKDVHIVVIADGNGQIFKDVLKENFDSLSVRLNVDRKDWVYSINKILKEFDSEYYIYASDDLFFRPDCIEKAMMIMKKRFPNGFGVVSLSKKGRCIFGLMGRKFVDHFPEREVMCPDFVHFGADSELLRTVKELNAIAYIPDEYRVKHFRKKDETYRLAHRIRARDREVFHERQAKGYKWGIDFNLVTKHD